MKKNAQQRFLNRKKAQQTLDTICRRIPLVYESSSRSYFDDKYAHFMGARIERGWKSNRIVEIR